MVRGLEMHLDKYGNIDLVVTDLPSTFFSKVMYRQSDRGMKALV